MRRIFIPCLFLEAHLLLGSIYGLFISMIAVFVLVGRIISEEKMLVNELEGYEDYYKEGNQ